MKRQPNVTAASAPAPFGLVSIDPAPHHHQPPPWSRLWSRLWGCGAEPRHSVPGTEMVREDRRLHMDARRLVGLRLCTRRQAWHGDPAHRALKEKAAVCVDVEPMLWPSMGCMPHMVLLPTVHATSPHPPAAPTAAPSLTPPLASCTPCMHHDANTIGGN